MKRVISALLLAVVLITSATVLSSCGAKDNGAQISVYLGDRVWGFDPAADYSDDATIGVMYLLYEPLFYLDGKGRAKGAMAKDYSFDKQTGDLWITLRESYWSNGSRVCADDFVYAWKRILDPTFTSAAAPLLYDVKNAAAVKSGAAALDTLGVWATATDTLHITFERGDVDRDAFLRNLSGIALSPVNRSCVVGQEAYWANAASSICYTNGPFRVQSLDSALGYFTLERNAGYHRPADSKKAVDHFVRPELLRTVWNIDETVTDADYLASVAEQYAQNTVFYVGELSLSDRKALQGSAAVRDTMSTYSYLFNVGNPLFADPAVRRILSSVIDRSALAELVTFARPATGLIPDTVWKASSYKESFRSYAGDRIGAAVSTADARSELDALGARRGSFRLTCLDRESDRAIAEYVAALWGDLGYTVEVTPVSYHTVTVREIGSDQDSALTYRTSAIESLWETGDFDVIGMDYQMLSVNALTALASFSRDWGGSTTDLGAYNLQEKGAEATLSDYRALNPTGYFNPEYEACIAAAAATSDLSARAESLSRAEAILLDDAPVVPLLFNQTFSLCSGDLKKVNTNYWGFPVFTEAKLKDYRNRFFPSDGE